MPFGVRHRNLLFGILALQMDFITRDALVQAMNAWILDKAEPLGQILVEHGALQLEKRDLLETLVQAHLEMHGGDAEHSLAAVSATGSARKELEQIADPDLQASLAQVSAARPPDEDSWSRGPITPAAAPADRPDEAARLGGDSSKSSARRCSMPR
jgi:hypothetical protein